MNQRPNQKSLPEPYLQQTVGTIFKGGFDFFGGLIIQESEFLVGFLHVCPHFY